MSSSDRKRAAAAADPEGDMPRTAENHVGSREARCGGDQLGFPGLAQVSRSVIVRLIRRAPGFDSWSKQ